MHKLCKKSIAVFLSIMLLMTSLVIVPPGVGGMAAANEPGGTIHTVTNAGDWENEGELRQVLAAAAPGDIIEFDTGAMGGKQIWLNSPLVIDKNITIRGSGKGIMLDGQNLTRVLNIAAGAVVRLESLRFEKGQDQDDVVGGIFNAGELTLVNSIVAGNNASAAGGVGGIFQEASPNAKLVLINSTIAGNTGAASADGVGGVAVLGGTVEIYNSIIYGNTGEHADAYFQAGIAKSYHSLYGFAAEAFAIGEGSNNLFAVDPLFVDNGYHAYRLRAGSPAIDAGNNNYIDEQFDVRGAGYGRKINATDGTEGMVDVGAYEFSGKSGETALWAWGSNGNGAVGDGSNTNTFRNTPTLIGDDADWAAIAVGGAANHTVAIKTDGSLWAWGNNWGGKLGDGTDTNRNIPIRIGADTNWATVVVGGKHTVALKTDGTLWAWGKITWIDWDAGMEQIEILNNTAPIQMGTDADWAAVAAGDRHFMAIKNNGTLWAWGRSDRGQLGDGTSGEAAYRTTPTQIGDDTNWLTVAAGYSHTVAIKTDGTLWAWGENWNGQLGDGTSGPGTEKSTPTRVGDAADWAAVSAGGEHTVALKTDGSLWAWGANSGGRLGDGTTTSKNTPTRIGEDTDWRAVSAGREHTVALKNNGSLWTWGGNGGGQLGDGTQTNRYSPTRIGEATDWTAIAAGSEHSVALREAPALPPAMPPVAQPTNLTFSTNTNKDIVLSYTASETATNYLIVRRIGAEPAFVPESGTGYTAGSQGAAEILYVGPALTYTDAAAQVDQDYYYSIYAFNGSSAGTAYLTDQPLKGHIKLQSGATNASITVDAATNSTSAGFSDAGVNITFPAGVAQETALTVSKITSQPAANFMVQPNIRRMSPLYFEIEAQPQAPGNYILTLDFSSLNLTQDQWDNFVILKRADANSPWVNIEDLGAVIENRQTDGVWGKFTISGLSSFSHFAGGEAADIRTVTNAGDSGAGTLRNILGQAAAGDIIEFNVDQMGGSTITLSSAIVIDKDLVIRGAGNRVVLDGNNVTRVLEITNGAVVRLESLRIENGNDNNNEDMVGGILNDGQLTLVNSVVAGNEASGVVDGYGGIGGILQDVGFLDAKLVLINSTIAGNTGADSAGGVGGVAVFGGTVEIYNSIIYGNTGEDADAYYQTGIAKSYHSLYGFAGDTFAIDEGNNNLFATNPLFVGTGEHPYLLSAGSPAIDAGNNIFIYDQFDVRGEGFERKINSTGGSETTVDIGAYEYIPPDTYTVTFETNGGSVVTSQTVEHGSQAAEPTAPTRSGYTFSGWYIDNELTTAYDFTAEVTSDLTLYAGWTINEYTVTFESNGGGEVASQTVEHGSTATEPATPTREGYIFTGWYKDDNLQNQWNFGTDTVTVDITLYARWIDAASIYITVNPNNVMGSLSFDQIFTLTVNNDTVAGALYATDLTLGGVFANLSIGGVSNTGNTVTAAVYGNLDTKGTGTITLDAGKLVLSTEALTAEVMVGLYNVTYVGNGNTAGTVPTDSNEYAEGAAVIVLNNTGDLKRTGYTFTGWNTQADGSGTGYAPNATLTMGAANVTLYAVWTIKEYTVSFNSNGGSTTASQTVNHGGTATAPTAPTRAGYTFAGWYSDSSLTTQYNFAIPVTADMTLFAKWNAVSYDDGDSSTPTPSTETKEEVITAPVETGNRGNGAVILETPIKRTTGPSGTKRDEVVFAANQAKETAQAVKTAGQNTIRIVIPDQNDEVAQVDVRIPKEAVGELANEQIGLEVYTENARIVIPQASLANINEDIFFRVVPIKEEAQRQEVEERTRVEQVVQQASQGRDIRVVARPMTIETNLRSRAVDLILPLREVQLPDNAAERAKFLAELVIFIEHSDGERVIIRPEVVTFGGQMSELGMQFRINKFSTFTIVHMEGWQEEQENLNFHAAYVTGYPNGTFRPNQAVTRAEMATMLARNLGFKNDSSEVLEGPFPDVSLNHWASATIGYVKEVGLMQGDPDGIFRPDDQITRAEMAALAVRYKELEVDKDLQSSAIFPDVTDHWAAGAIEAAQQAGLVQGYPDGTFGPGGSLTRAEAVTIINRMFNRGPLHGVEVPTWGDVPTVHWAIKDIEEASRDHYYIIDEKGLEILQK